jgi:hypothetical protein
MDRVEFTFRRGGRTQMVTPTQAKVLQRAGLGTYQTRDMAAQPMVTRPMVAQVATPPAVEAAPLADDGLEGLDKEQLHALAKERGVKVHHMAGADKVRAALREAA